MVENANSGPNSRYLDGKDEPNKLLTPIEGYEGKPLISLEESFERIKKLVDDEQTKELVGDKHIKNLVQDLDTRIWIANENSKEPKNNLTQDESAAIRLYSMQWSDSDDNLCTVLNKILRSEKRDILKPWFSYLKLFLTALFKLPSKKGILWRGIRGNVSDQYKVNKVWWGFSSCTETMGQIDNFLGQSGERTIFMIECVNGKAIRHHSQYPEENEILLMPGSYLRVIDKHSPAQHLYIIHLQEVKAPYELLKPPFDSDLTPIMPLVLSDIGISSKDTTDSHVTNIKSHVETYTMIDPKAAIEIEAHRLFYVDHDNSSNDEGYKIAGDSQNMSKVILELHRLKPNRVQLFGIFGEIIALKFYLHSLFPNNHSQIQTVLDKFDPMPAIWTIYNNMKFVFLLMSTHDIASEKEYYFMIVMQRFLQDICRNILICPSDVFFSNFSIEHSFHGKTHGTRTYRQVKKGPIDIQPPQKTTLDDKNIFKTLLIEQPRSILITNSTPNTYCYKKTFQESNYNSTNNKFNELKELLNDRLDISVLSLRLVFNLCEQCGIFLSKRQESKIGNIIENHTKMYDDEIMNNTKAAKSLIKEFLGSENIFGSFWPGGNIIDDKLKIQLYNETIDWLINPIHIGENANQFSDRLTVIIYSHKSHQNGRIKIEPQRLEYFISELQRTDKKEKMRPTQETLIQSICVAVQSENQFEIHYDIHRLYYNPINDTENRLQGLSVTSFTPTKISLNDLGLLMNLSDLSESDRLDFSKQLELIACFKMNDDKSEIIVIKRPNIMTKKLCSTSGYTVLLYKSGVFRKITDFIFLQAHMAYASNQNSHTLVVYNIENGIVTKCLLDESGQIQSCPVLFLHDRSKKPFGVRSLALTAAQDLLVLIDSNSSVYEIDISTGDVATIKLLVKNKSRPNDKPNFTAANGDLYQTVQTIGEKNPVFFFQAKSCIDIIDQNYSQIYSIELEKSSLLYHMQIFTDFIDTYCVLFDGDVNQVYYIQNLVSDTRIERQDSNTNLDKSIKPYIGNRLLDIIKRGEIQFGVPDLSKKNQYHFILSSEYSEFSDRIQKYYDDLDLKAQLKIGYEENDLIYSPKDIDHLIKTVISRVPLQLCTIEMGTLVPLNNGRRDKMDHLSSKSFRIDMKAREILFSFLDNVLNDINEKIKIVGVIGHQATGKSYLMNRIFRTRFAVTAGRYTDGIWMSYAFLENTHFIILDCEGLFNDQRTEDEEIKLISFLSAFCDITILNQDLGFSRFQDRLFDVLSHAIDKIGINDKLFKGILLVVVRDISDGNRNESFGAVEKKFLDLQKRGKSGFLEQMFSNTFKVQLLHHFENKNFDYEIEELRQIFIKHVMIDETTGLELPCRWENGKDLSDRLKILLVQLYTDDFLDSNDIHADMELAELEEEMK